MTSVDDGEKLTVHTLYDGDVTIDAKDVLPDRCLGCKSKKHVAYDELLGEDGEVIDSNRFDEVEKLEKMTPDERFAFWQGELSRLHTLQRVPQCLPGVYLREVRVRQPGVRR